MADHVIGFDLNIEQVDAYEMRVRFDKPTHPDLLLDEPPPLGKDKGPNPARVLAAAIANCLTASMVFCLSRKGVKVEGMKSTARVELVRNENKRLRIGKVAVTLKPPLAKGDQALEACLSTFEDFCIVTQSVRGGIAVDVKVEAQG